MHLTPQHPLRAAPAADRLGHGVGSFALHPLAVCAVVIAMYAAGTIDKAGLVETQARLACPLMLAVMLLRFRDYADAHDRAHS